MLLKTELQKLMGGTTSIIEGYRLGPMAAAPAPAAAAAPAAAPAPAPAPAAAAANSIGLSTPGTERQQSNTEAIMKNTEDLNTINILVFVIHVLFAIIIAYIWGILGSNILFLITRSNTEKEYILPTDRYNMPYCYKKDTPSFFSYGFPYNLLPRQCSDQNLPNVIDMEMQNVYLLNAIEKGGTGNGVSQALYNYIFDSVYGGLGQAGRSVISAFLNIFDTTDTSKGKDDNTWENMKASGGRKFLIFLIFPFLLFYIIIGLGFVAGIGGLIFGIISKHPFWGIIFTLIFGFFIALGNGFWMAIQSVYIFCFYPCLNIRNKNEYNTIFNDIKPYMLFIFYVLITLYAFQDLGNSGGAGILFLIIVAYFSGNAT